MRLRRLSLPALRYRFGLPGCVPLRNSAGRRSRLNVVRRWRCVPKEGKLWLSGCHARIIFAFDPKLAAIFLIAGDEDKKWTKWYQESIPIAERLLTTENPALPSAVVAISCPSKTQRPRRCWRAVGLNRSPGASLLNMNRPPETPKAAPLRYTVYHPSRPPRQGALV